MPRFDEQELLALQPFPPVAWYIRECLETEGGISGPRVRFPPLHRLYGVHLAKKLVDHYRRRYMLAEVQL